MQKREYTETEGRLLETLLVEDGAVRHLSSHNERMNRCRRTLFGATDRVNIAERLGDMPRSGRWRCRVLYTLYIERVEFLPYSFRPLRSFALTECDIDYSCKYEDRTAFGELKALYPDTDDLVLLRRGMLTDTTTANIALLMDGEWFTPADPLLKGTTRQRLLDEGLLRERELTPGDLSGCSGMAVMNALSGFRRLENAEIETEEGTIAIKGEYR